MRAGTASASGTGVVPPITRLIAPVVGTVVGAFGSFSQRTSSNTSRAASAAVFPGDGPTFVKKLVR